MSSLIFVLAVCWYVVVIFLGVGFVIFVHELGHFAVAKLCGVKCEKFYLGFDIGGWKICKFRWGETEYGIGILPLGGYVKMLGQEDNPAKLKEEIERAKLQKAESANSPATAANDQPSADDIDLAEAEKALYDPRSYLAMSVPKRMAIISAGVIMNVIFGFLMAVVAYSMGVSQPICAVGQTFPGEAGWRAGLRTGDEILEVAGKKVIRFKDLQKNVTLGDLTEGVPLLIKRPGEAEPRKIMLFPDRIRDLPSIGVGSIGDNKLISSDLSGVFCVPHTAAAKANPPLDFDDRIAMINGEKIENFQQLQAYLANNPEKPLHLTVECIVPGENGAPATTKQVEVVVPAQPMRTLGLAMAMGEIAAVQDDSPAAKAGIVAGDKILKIDGAPTGDPMRLPDVLRRRTGETIRLTISRKDAPQTLEIPVELRKADWDEATVVKNAPISVPQLGIAYRVLNSIEQVQPGSPADKAGILPGTTIKTAVIEEKKDKSEKKISEFDFSEENNWPALFIALQTDNPDIRVKLTTTDGKTYELALVNAADWFNPDRGFILEPKELFHQASSIGEAVRWGAEETWEQMTMVVKIMRKMGSRQISATNLGGPGTIAYVAYLAAKRGFPTLLLFLTMLSANLAVLNILPIPMLDGGHLVFLTYEGIRGKPANERVQIVLSVIGLILLLALMIFVCGMDVKRFLFAK